MARPDTTPTTAKQIRNTEHQSQKAWAAYVAALIFSDMLSISIAFLLSHWLRFSSGLPIFSAGGLKEAPFYDAIMLGVIPIWLTLFALMGLYKRSMLLGGIREYATLFNAVSLGMLLIVLARFSLPDDLILARGWALMAWLLSFLFAAIMRFILRRIVYGLRARGFFRLRSLMVGFNEEGALMAQQFHDNPASSVALLGYVSAGPHSIQNGLVERIGPLADLDNLIEQQRISRLILITSALTRQEVLELYQKYANRDDLELLLSSGLYEMVTTGMEVQVDGFVPLMKVNRLRMTGIDLTLKTIMDYGLTILLVILLLPLMALIALWVKADSPGPIIYRRRVLGLNGRQFDAFKFRSMDTRSEEILRSDPRLLEEYLRDFKIANDPRITRSGKVLRKLSLDELPQLFNVLRGEMSLVGPRMITPEELAKYNQWAHNLLTVKPGLTGFWQVHGRSDVRYEERVRMDMYYIRNWTIWLDVQLLVSTIPAVLAQRGAF